MKRPKQILISLFLAAVLAACNLPDRSAPIPTLDQGLVGTIAAMTLEAMHTQTPTTAPSATLTRTPVMTSTQTTTITPTYSVPILEFSGNTNCRKGPGTGYEVENVIRSGQRAEAVGVLGIYWLIKNPAGKGTCWVVNDYAKPSGSVWMLPTVTAPPTPSPQPLAAPVWSDWKYSCEFASGGSTITMNLLWTDQTNAEDGYTVTRDGQAVVTLGPNTTSYTDVTFVAAGQSVTYTVEVFNKTGRASSSKISATCQ